MAWVKTFRINPEYGLPDKDIRTWLTQCEEEGKAIITTTVQYIPALGTADPRLTVIVTKLDDLPGTGFEIPDVERNAPDFD